MYDFTASIVTYNTPTTDLEKIIKCFQKIKLNFKLWISDNSETDALRSFFEKINDDRIEYIFNNANKGFGEGHNRIIKKVAGDPKLSEFHLAINADIYFKENTIEKIVEYMKEHEEIGQIGPKITDLEGNFSYTCRLFPTPMNLIFRRFLPFKSIVDRMDYDYEMRWANFEKIMEVPILSGCFIFSRISVLNEIVVYYPEVKIFHEHGKASYKSRKLMMFHIKSAIKYFNKWGWFFDKERKIKNDEMRKRYKNLGGK